MENKNMKHTQQTQKDLKLDSKKRDRGDSFKKQNGGKVKTNDKSSVNSVPKPIITDRGDSPTSKVAVARKTNQNDKTFRDNANEKGSKLGELKPRPIAVPIAKTFIKVVNDTDKALNFKTSGTKVGDRKHINEKVNLRTKIFNIQHVKKDLKSPEKPDLGNVRGNIRSKENVTDSHKFEARNETEGNKENDKVNRKPLIKTVKSKNEKVYKAVTFTEKKIVNKPTVLEISIPNIQEKKTLSALADKNLEAETPTVTMISNNKSTSKLSVKERTQHNRRNRVTERTKRKKLNRCISSPDKFKRVESPPTEVAKWAPSCLNAHTKPYYEAWVNTTLAAISKVSKNDKLFLEKQNIIKQFQKSLEAGTESPEIVHEDYNNEFYTGKIKIKHRRASKSKRQPLITPLLDKDFTI